jgi:hypothetical protein
VNLESWFKPPPTAKRIWLVGEQATVLTMSPPKSFFLVLFPYNYQPIIAFALTPIITVLLSKKQID